jgi:probable DNA metabolism protein
MTTYIFDNTLDGLLTAVFDSFALHQQPQLLAEGEQLPLFADEPHRVVTDEEKAARVWKGLEKHLSREALRIISISWMSEERTLNQPLFNYICKVFLTGKDLSHNASDPDVLAVRNTCRRVLHEEQRMKQFIRFQKAKDGTYLAVVAPDHNVLPLIIDHFLDRFNDQSWLIYDARRHYGYYYGSPLPTSPHPTGPHPTSPIGEESSAQTVFPPRGDKRGAGAVVRITFEDETSVPFDLTNGKLDAAVLSTDDQLFQDLWRTYFKAICIRERINPRKQLNDMPRRYWRYMTEKN